LGISETDGRAFRAVHIGKFSRGLVGAMYVRIDLDTEARIGPGKIQLLENIRACGSISAAGRAMGMSCKRAWDDLVDEINRICRRVAVEREIGGKNGGGAILTPSSSLYVGDQKRPIILRSAKPLAARVER
jgi:molybdate transport repressor ModE-like protein